MMKRIGRGLNRWWNDKSERRNSRIALMTTYELHMDDKIIGIKRKISDGSWYGTFWQRDDKNDFDMRIAELEEKISEHEEKLKAG